MGIVFVFKVVSFLLVSPHHCLIEGTAVIASLLSHVFISVVGICHDSIVFLLLDFTGLGQMIFMEVPVIFSYPSIVSINA